jgi:N-acetylmuramic acid 6-phosphate etherase
MDMDWTPQAAQRFLDHERQFRLGCLLTEQSHPKTRWLSQTLAQDIQAGIRLLQSVDRDIPPAARRAMAGPAFGQLVSQLKQALREGRRIFFTGCGATGRLAILLEASWRRLWGGLAARSALPENLAGMGDRVVSVMAGGDFALIRSVEGFEDFAGFGRRQLQEAGVAAGDVVVAVTEGGETSFVIGAAWQALESGADAFFVFNNPSEPLSQTVARSAEVLAEPRITKLDLHTGPMAVAGSTRMQATTIELLVLATAMEEALAGFLEPLLGQAGLERLGMVRQPAEDRVEAFDRLLDELESPASVSAMARQVELEEELYRRGGLVTYFADGCLLDILTDTTERSPTFALPPFAPCDDAVARPSWAFVKNPACPTPQAWQRMLGRMPRGLGWAAEVYERLGAPGHLAASPPDLRAAQVLKFRIGCEDDPGRHGASPNLAMAIRAGGLPGDADFDASFAASAAAFGKAAVLSIGPAAAEIRGCPVQLHVPCRLSATPLNLWTHLAAKLVFNTVSTATMGRLGRLAGNWMIYVQPGNKKLIDRGTRLVAELAGLDYDQACRELFATIRLLQRDPDAFGRAPSPAAATIQRLAGDWPGRPDEAVESE